MSEDRVRALAQQLWDAVYKIADPSTLDEVPDQDRADTLQLIACEALSTSPPPIPNVVGMTDTELFDALAANSWDLRSVSVPTGGDDCDVDWVVIEHHMAEPQERTIAQAYRDDPREAIRRAMRATDANAERCVACDEVLHDGDSVYYEHGEGGYIHSWCTNDDPASFVDEDEVPLKAGDEIPKPFAYRLDRAALAATSTEGAEG